MCTADAIECRLTHWSIETTRKKGKNTEYETKTFSLFPRMKNSSRVYVKINRGPKTLA